MKWSNLFKMYVHAYDPYEMDGVTVYHIEMFYPWQGLFYDIRKFGFRTAWQNFVTIMKKDNL